MPSAKAGRSRSESGLVIFAILITGLIVRVRHRLSRHGPGRRLHPTRSAPILFAPTGFFNQRTPGHGLQLVCRIAAWLAQLADDRRSLSHGDQSSSAARCVRGICSAPPEMLGPAVVSDTFRTGIVSGIGVCFLCIGVFIVLQGLAHVHHSR